eukprot:6096349-Pleurochrysis_carterae.AAC.3
MAPAVSTFVSVHLPLPRCGLLSYYTATIFIEGWHIHDDTRESNIKLKTSSACPAPSNYSRQTEI